MSTGFEIREATEADSRALAQVQVDSTITAYALILPEDYLATLTYADQEAEWHNLLSRETGEIALVAALPGGDIAGYALCWAEPGEVQGYDSELNAIHVRHARRRHGIGTALLRELARRLLARGCHSLMLWVFEDNANGRAWCEHLGAKVVSDGEWSGNQEYEAHVHEVAYAWDDLSALCDMTSVSEPQSRA